MKNVLRLQVAALGLATLCSPVRTAHAQPPCSGFGLSLNAAAQKELTRPNVVAADFSAWKDNTGSHAFVAPGKIWPIGRGQFYLVQSSNLLKLTHGTGVLSGKAVNFNALNTAAGDGANVYFLNGKDRIRIEPAGDVAVLPYGLSYDIVFDGTYVWILQGDGISTLYLVRGVYNPKLAAKMTFTSQKVASSSTNFRKLAYDGRYIWAANNTGSLYKFDGFKQVAEYKVGPAGAPQSLTFDGYSMWLVIGSSNTIYRVRVIDGTILSGVSSPGSPRDLAFDGKYMLVPDDINGSLGGYRACDMTPMPQYKVPVSPEFTAFDGVNYWVSSPSQNTVSIR